MKHSRNSEAQMVKREWWIVSSKTLGEAIIDNEKEAQDLYTEENERYNNDAVIIHVIPRAAADEREAKLVEALKKSRIYMKALQVKAKSPDSYMIEEIDDTLKEMGYE